MRCETLGIVALLLAASLGAQSEVKFAANRSSEPLAALFCFDTAVAFMDDAARTWNTEQGCVTCHTNGLYLVARAAKGDYSRATAYLETLKTGGLLPEGLRLRR